jgi:putative tricarboxylic transport membrane protein
MAMLILSVVYCVSAYTLDADFDPTHEKFYPLCLSVSMVVLSLVLLIRPVKEETGWPKGKNLIKIGVTLCAILLYSLLLQSIGFLLCTVVFMGLCMWVFEAERNWILPVSLCVTVLFYIVFDRLLGLTLPSGLLTFL